MGTKKRILPNGDEVVALDAVGILNKRCLRLERENKVLRELLNKLPTPIFNTYIADEVQDAGFII